MTDDRALVRGDLADELARRVVVAGHAAFGLRLTTDKALIRPSTAGRGADYQSNVAMGLAKRLGRPSREVAAELIEHLEVADLTEPPTVGGPGFVNFTLRREWLEQHSTGLAGDERLGVPVTAEPARVVVDLSAPNVAKEMHVGHLRTTVIGDAIVRLLRHAGHEVIPQNHVGDWGTPFGMLLEHLVDEGWAAPGANHAIADLGTFYQAARAKFDADPDFADRARQRVVALQGGDPPTLELWRELVAESERHFAEVYRLLDIGLGPADTRGESFYNPLLADLVDELEKRGLAVPSDGALCVFPGRFVNRDGEALPLIVRKRDGGYTYDTTDLAALRYRAQDLKADRILYVVGAPQRLHFEMVFEAGRDAGWLPVNVRPEHVTFGSILGEDGKPLRTRAGDTIKLIDLLHEAVDRAGAVVLERSTLSAEEQADVAVAVGVGAVKFADLASDREKDYQFSWSRMLAQDGNTSVYLQYANARIQSVLRKAGTVPDPGTPVLLGEPAERALALALARYPAAFEATLRHLQPHRLCGYLYDLAAAFSVFFESCPILKAESDEVRDSRLALSQLTSRVLTQGLDLLGIDAPPRL
jgi:arginyl-tRNA synthetase